LNPSGYNDCYNDYDKQNTATYGTKEYHIGRDLQLNILIMGQEIKSAKNCLSKINNTKRKISLFLKIAIICDVDFS